MAVIIVYVLLALVAAGLVQFQTKHSRHVKVLFWLGAVCILATPIIAKLWATAYPDTYYAGPATLAWLFGGSWISIIIDCLAIASSAMYIACILTIRMQHYVKAGLILILIVTIFYSFDSAVYRVLLPPLGL
jgi:hypothetical protein